MSKKALMLSTAALTVLIVMGMLGVVVVLSGSSFGPFPLYLVVPPVVVALVLGVSALMLDSK